MKNKPLIITFILFGVVLAVLIIYLNFTQNMTYDKLLEELTNTETITIKENLTIESKTSSKAYDRKITNQKQIKKIVKFISSGKNNNEECWHDLPSPDYKVEFLNNKEKIIVKFTILKEDEHIHLIGDNFNYRVDLNVPKLIKHLYEQE